MMIQSIGCSCMEAPAVCGPHYSRTGTRPADRQPHVHARFAGRIRAMNTLVQDVRHALRAFRRTPVFTAGAVLSLAIGIGANSAIFSVASALLLRPLPYRQADRLAILWNRSPGLGITEDWFSTAQYFDIRATRAFEDVAVAIGRSEERRVGKEGR